MTTAYTSLLGLALPVTGELSGVWGDTVNNSITSLLDAAIAGTTTLSTDADVTLTNLDGTADTSRQAILLCTGARTAIRTITAPALSKIYTVINSTTGGFSVKIVAAGPTAGVTIIAGEAAMIAWNGSDFVKVSNTGGSFTTQDLTVTGNTILGDAITDTTTLNAQTRFQSRAILGYANMTGPATTSLTTTAPAFLYSGATTYTVSDVSGGTQTHAPIISLGQATITNASTNTIYTNASTLYIAGAPSAGTNITITNPYALYVAAGASYLGGNTAVTGTLSATGVTTLQAGTNLLPALTTTGDTNTGIFFPAADTIAFTEGGAEAMRIDSSGNLLVGTTSSSIGASGRGVIEVNGTSDAVFASKVNGTLAAVSGLASSTEVVYGAVTNVPVVFRTNNTERGRFSADGTFRVNGAGTAGSTDAFQVAGGAPANAVVLNSSGFLGIGQPSPISFVDMYGSGAYTYARFWRSDEAGYGGRVGTGNTLYGSATTRSLGLDGFSSISFGIAGSQVAQINSTGGLKTLNTIGVGDATPSTSGAGITFPATQSASSDANTLDDYEEGTWSSAVTNAANLTGTGSLDGAVYTKIGRLVTIVGRITGQTITTVTTGTAAGLTLPFAMIATDSIVMGPCRGSGGTEMIGIILDATGADATSVNLNFPAAQITANGATTFSFSLTYQASA